MAKWTVKFFNTTKWFWFIKPEAGWEDIFVHVSALESAWINSLADNQPISYELVEDRKGRMSAWNLELI